MAAGAILDLQNFDILRHGKGKKGKGCFKDVGTRHSQAAT